MTVDINPFSLSINMVSVFISQKEKMESKVSRWERKLKEKDEAGPSRKTIWRTETMKTQETGRQNMSQRVSVF